MTVSDAAAPSIRSGVPRVKLFIAIGLVTFAIGYLVFSSVKTSSAYYMTVSELRAAGTSIENKNVRLAGTVIGDSIQWDAKHLMLNFDLSDGGGRIPVSYKGARPDMFKDGADAVVEGKYSGDTFRATNLLLKCPSKYQDNTSTPAS